MKLFSKLKNVLFEEEEIEVPVEEPKTKIAAAEPPKKVEKMTFKEKEEEPIVTDRELFKAEKTFDFPAFDDNEFESMKNISLDLDLKDEKKEEKKKESMSINLIDYEKPKPKRTPVRQEKKAEEIKGRAYPTKNEEIKSTKFKPSPVISPVYGVLDKNYHKEDLIVKKDKKDIDVDIVRKKAFGTLEEDLEKSLNKPVKEFYQEKITEEQESEDLPKIKEEKSIEDLLEETSYDEIDIQNEEDEKEELFDTDTIELEQIDKPKEKTEEEKDEETLENDLFDLIDSMYDNKEDE